MNNNKAENSPSGKNTKPGVSKRAKGASQNAAKRKIVTCEIVASLFKAVCCFLQLSRGLKLGNRYFEKYC